MKTSADYQRVLSELERWLRCQGRDDEAVAVELARKAWIFGETRVNMVRSVYRTLRQVLSGHLLEDLRRACEPEDLFPDRAGHLRG